MKPKILKVYEKSEMRRVSIPNFWGCETIEEEKEQVNIEEFQLITQLQGWKFGVIRGNGVLIDEKDKIVALNNDATEVLISLINGKKINIQEESIRKFI